MFTCDFVSEMNERLDDALTIKELREKAKCHKMILLEFVFT